jgi:hypothetical protein
MGLTTGLTRATLCAGSIVLSVMRHRDPVGWDLKGDQAACFDRRTYEGAVFVFERHAVGCAYRMRHS